MHMSPPLPDRSTNAFAWRDFRYFFFCKLLFNLAILMTVVGVGWQVYDLARRTRSIEGASLMLGLLGLIEFLAVAGFSLLAGYFIDRADRRKIVRAALVLDYCALLALWAYSRRHDPALWPIFAITGVIGIGRAFMAPATSALAPNVVAREALPSAVAWNSIAWQVAAVAGPALCGFLIHRGASAVYLTALPLLALALFCALMIRPVPLVKHSDLGPLESIRAGLAYIRTNPIVLGAISLDLFVVILGGATAMLPAFARDILHVGSDGFGLLRAAPAVGAGIVAIALAVVPLRRKVGLWMFGCVGLFGLATIVFGLSKSAPLSLVALATLGAADMISVYIRQSLVQINTPDHLRGRVASVSTIFISASNELGELESGLAARFLGAVPSVVAGGIGALVITGLWAWWFVDLRRADRLTPEPA